MAVVEEGSLTALVAVLQLQPLHLAVVPSPGSHGRQLCSAQTVEGGLCSAGIGTGGVACAAFYLPPPSIVERVIELFSHFPTLLALFVSQTLLGNLFHMLSHTGHEIFLFDFPVDSLVSSLFHNEPNQTCSSSFSSSSETDLICSDYFCCVTLVTSHLEGINTVSLP